MPDISVDALCLPGLSTFGCFGSSEKKAPRFCINTPEPGSVTQEPKSKYKLCTRPTALPYLSAMLIKVVSLPPGRFSWVRLVSASHSARSAFASAGSSNFSSGISENSGSVRYWSRLLNAHLIAWIIAL
ncbi:hypothetical protein D3C81_1406120 [compost metagenome]